MHKGLLPFPADRAWSAFGMKPQLLVPRVPSFIRSLTDPYEIEFMYWEGARLRGLVKLRTGTPDGSFTSAAEVLA